MDIDDIIMDGVGRIGIKGTEVLLQACKADMAGVIVFVLVSVDGVVSIGINFRTGDGVHDMAFRGVFVNVVLMDFVVSVIRSHICSMDVAQAYIITNGSDRL